MWYVASSEMCGEMSREERKVARCGAWLAARGCRVSIMRRHSVIVDEPF